jgi:hypothetical protein
MDLKVEARLKPEYQKMINVVVTRKPQKPHDLFECPLCLRTIRADGFYNDEKPAADICQSCIRQWTGWQSFPFNTHKMSKKDRSIITALIAVNRAFQWEVINGKYHSIRSI